MTRHTGKESQTGERTPRRPADPREEASLKNKRANDKIPDLGFGSAAGEQTPRDDYERNRRGIYGGLPKARGRTSGRTRRRAKD